MQVRWPASGVVLRSGGGQTPTEMLVSREPKAFLLGDVIMLINQLSEDLNKTRNLRVQKRPDG